MHVWHRGDAGPPAACFSPQVKCLTKVYHPNIDLEGNVCLNILREDWKPVLSINSIIYGLQVRDLWPHVAKAWHSLEY